MKITFYENDRSAGFNLYPETPEDVAQLLRITNNAKQQPPSITFYFGSSCNANIHLDKVEPQNQIHTMTSTKNSRKQ